MVAGEPMVVKPERVLRHPTSYLETLIHILKGNMGSGMFAMGEAFKHAGLALGTCLTAIIGIICIYNNHVLITCAEFVHAKKDEAREGKEDGKGMSFSDTVEFSFVRGPPFFQKWNIVARRLVKGFVITTQIGFCCVYVVLVSSTLRKVVINFGLDLDERLYMLMIYVPILGSSLITSLKFLAPISLGSNICVIGAVFLTLYVACSYSIPDPSTRALVADPSNLPLFVGTVIYAFEGIGLVLPLQNEMKKPEQFGSTFGVLNVGLVIVMILLIVVGFIGYLVYGDDVQGSLSLNIPSDDVLGIVVQIIFAIGIGFSYPLQFYVASDIIWDDINDKWGPFKRKQAGKHLLKTVLVTCTFIISAIIPNVGLFIALIGAVCSTALALVFPALSDISLRTSKEDPLISKCNKFKLFMDVLTLLIAVIGFTTGAYCSIIDITKAFISESDTNK